MLYQFSLISLFFFFNDTATTEIYTLSLHDALPISVWGHPRWRRPRGPRSSDRLPREARDGGRRRRDLPHLQPGHRGPGRHARDRAAHAGGAPPVARQPEPAPPGGRGRTDGAALRWRARRRGNGAGPHLCQATHGRLRPRGPLAQAEVKRGRAAPLSGHPRRAPAPRTPGVKAEVKRGRAAPLSW